MHSHGRCFRHDVAVQAAFTIAKCPGMHALQAEENDEDGPSLACIPVPQQSSMWS